MSYRFDRFTEHEAKREAQLESQVAEEIECNRLNSRSTWERIADLSESDELKDVLWHLLGDEE